MILTRILMVYVFSASLSNVPVTVTLPGLASLALFTWKSLSVTSPAPTKIVLVSLSLSLTLSHSLSLPPYFSLSFSLSQSLRCVPLTT